MDGRKARETRGWPVLVPLVLAWAGAAAGAPAAAGGAPVPAGPAAEAVYSNIQVLRGSPAEQLLPAMEFVAASLGVACEHCHVAGAYEKDDKPAKEAAREMMRMVLALARERFEGRLEVTCWTCHRGAVRPAAEPPAAAAGDAGAAAAAAAAEGFRSGAPADGDAARAASAAREAFARHAAAAGGRDALLAVTARAARGTVTLFGGREFPLEVLQRAPLRSAVVMRLPGGDSVATADGAAGAVAAPGRPVRPMTGAELALAALGNDFHWAAHPEAVFADGRLLGRRRLGGREAAVVGAAVHGHPVELWFDVEDGLLRRALAWAETPLGRLPSRVDYHEYREVAGVRTPVRWTVARPQGEYTVRLDAIEPNAAIDDRRLEPPAPAAGGAGG